MGRFREIIEQERTVMPDYQYRFLYKRVMPWLIVWLVGMFVALGASIAIGFLTDGSGYTFIPVGVWGVWTIILSVLYAVGSRKIAARLIFDRTQEFKDKFPSVDFAVAAAHLEKERIIVDGAVRTEGRYLPLSECKLYFFAQVAAGYVSVSVQGYSESNRAIFGIPLDEYSCAYFAGSNYDFVNRELFDLFVRDKETFLRLLFRYADSRRIGKRQLEKAEMARLKRKS